MSFPTSRYALFTQHCTMVSEAWCPHLLELFLKAEFNHSEGINHVVLVSAAMVLVWMHISVAMSLLVVVQVMEVIMAQVMRTARDSTSAGATEAMESKIMEACIREEKLEDLSPLRAPR